MDLQIISCTNRPGNLSIHLARFYQQALAEMKVRADLFNLEHLPLNILETDLYGKRSSEFLPIQQMINQTERFLFVVPEYNRSVPGIFKLLIDACDYPNSFRGKTGWSVGLGAGIAGNTMGLQHLRDIMDYLGTDIQPEQVTIGKVQEKMSKSGEITDAETRAELMAHVDQIAGAIQGPR